MERVEILIVPGTLEETTRRLYAKFMQITAGILRGRRILAVTIPGGAGGINWDGKAIARFPSPNPPYWWIIADEGIAVRDGEGRVLECNRRLFCEQCGWLVNRVHASACSAVA
jgi:hypothetical protein